MARDRSLKPSFPSGTTGGKPMPRAGVTGVATLAILERYLRKAGRILHFAFTRVSAKIAFSSSPAELHSSFS